MGRPQIHPPPHPERQAPLCLCLTQYNIRHGLCDRHWQEWKRTHPGLLPLAAIPLPQGRTVLARTCWRCGSLLPGRAFRRGGQDCRDCEKKKAREKDVSRDVGRDGVPVQRRLWRGRTIVAATCRQCDELKIGAEFEYKAKQGFLCTACHRRLAREASEQKQSESLPRARNLGKRWTGPELELVLRDDLADSELAEMLGRSYESISTARYKARRDPRYVRMAGVS